MKLKTLRYTHVCRRSFDVAERAGEQQIAAEAAIWARMRKLEQTTIHCVQHAVSPLGAKRDYSKLLIF